MDAKNERNKERRMGLGGGSLGERTNATVGDKERHVLSPPPTFIQVARTEKGRAGRTAGSKRRSAPEQNRAIETTSVRSQPNTRESKREPLSD